MTIIADMSDAPITLVNPNLLVQRNDPLTTGIVYMPIGLAYVASALRKSGVSVHVLDAFGAAPRRASVAGRFTILGRTPGEIAANVPPHSCGVFVYANQLLNHISVANILSAIRSAKPDLPLVVLENTQAVTAYALRHVANELFAAGATYLLRGEPEHRAVDVAAALQLASPRDRLLTIPGLVARDFETGEPPFIDDLDALPFPAWDLFPVENYWNLRFAHGPFYTKRYLPLLTSRGCPFGCRFCVAPETNHRRWRKRSPQNVVDEMEHWTRTMGVREFHWEDLNPTIDEERIVGICTEIRLRRLKVRWALAAGTKAESLKRPETLAAMAETGCRYVSISPESGSQRVLESMSKPVDLEHMVDLVRQMTRLAIRTQACFVLGFPGESKEDRLSVLSLIRRLTREGLDEIALFIITPVPGSAIYDQLQGYRSLSELNFTPIWRSDYRELNSFRLRAYSLFLLWKLLYHPFRFARQPLCFLRRRFETKMEMVPYRALAWKLAEMKARWQKHS